MNATNEVPQVMSIGSIVGGQTSSNRGWVESIRELARDVILCREGVTADINVNVEFQVPGTLLHRTSKASGQGRSPVDRLLKVSSTAQIAPLEPRQALLANLTLALDAVDAWCGSVGLLPIRRRIGNHRRPC